MATPKFKPSFRDLDLLFCLANHIRQHIDRELENDGLNVSQVQMLMFIGQHSDENQRCLANDIVRWVGLPKATTQNALTKLKRDGLVEHRAKDAWGADGRNQPLTLSTEGAEALKKSLATWKHATNRAFRVLDDGNLRQLSDALRNLQEGPLLMRRLFDLEDTRDWKYMQAVLER